MEYQKKQIPIGEGLFHIPSSPGEKAVPDGIEV